MQNQNSTTIYGSEMEMKSSGLFLPHYRSISEQNVQEIGSLHQNFLLTKCQNFTLIDAKIPKWYIIKKLRKISRDFLCYIHEAASFFSRRKKASYSYSIFHVDLSEYPSSSSMSSSSANYPSNCLTDSDSSSSSDENVESIFSDPLFIIVHSKKITSPIQLCWPHSEAYAI